MKNIIMCLLAVLVMTGCATRTEQLSSAGIDVNKGVPVVFIHPLDKEAYSQASVGVLPFAMPQNMDERMGAGIASMYKDIFLGKRTFPKVKVLSEQFGDLDEAVGIGKRAGTDLVLAGRVNYALEGTEFGGARLDVSVRLLNVNTGSTVWHVGQAMDQAMDYPKTDLLSLM
jgi:PBP1b-binding outer membrane lipoprotein LpoB